MRVKEHFMPIKTLLILLGTVLSAAAATIALAAILGFNFVWLGLAAALGALAVRRWV